MNTPSSPIGKVIVCRHDGDKCDPKHIATLKASLAVTQLVDVWGFECTLAGPYVWMYTKGDLTYSLSPDPWPVQQ